MSTLSSLLAIVSIHYSEIGASRLSYISANSQFTRLSDILLAQLSASAKKEVGKIAKNSLNKALLLFLNTRFLRN